MARPEALAARLTGLPANEIIGQALHELFPGRIALVSSFGAESAVLLHVVSTIDPALPVLFLDTQKHFPETLDYRDRLVARLGLTDVRSIRPDPAMLATRDPIGDLHAQNPDRCCAIRKVLPLEQALESFDATFTGRKRFQGGLRSELPVVEPDGVRLKINPLARWSLDELKAHILAHDLPRHPLVERGFLSIGCAPCTDRVSAAEDSRAGRWRGQAKTECGIHLPASALAGDLRRTRVPLIKDGAYVEDAWLRIEGEAPLPSDGDVIVDWSRLKEEASLGHARSGRLGVVFPNTEDANALSPHLGRIALVALELPSFTDGRAFSQASVLRHQLGFSGELRATGNPKADQAAFLVRCGFDAFEVRGTQPLEVWSRMLASVSRVYQRGYSEGAGAVKA